MWMSFQCDYLAEHCECCAAAVKFGEAAMLIKEVACDMSHQPCTCQDMRCHDKL